MEENKLYIVIGKLQVEIIEKDKEIKRLEGNATFWMDKYFDLKKQQDQEGEVLEGE